MQIVTDSIRFERNHGGPQILTKDINFGVDNVTSANVVLTGTDFGFSKNMSGDPDNPGDHHLGVVNIKVDATIATANIVRVTATFGVRDWSGDYDDDYEGNIYFAVIAETSP